MKKISLLLSVITPLAAIIIIKSTHQTLWIPVAAAAFIVALTIEMPTIKKFIAGGALSALVIALTMATAMPILLPDSLSTFPRMFLIIFIFSILASLPGLATAIIFKIILAVTNVKKYLKIS